MNALNTKLENALWSKLSGSNLVQGEIPNSPASDLPWYIRAMQGFAGWIAAFFILAFLVTIFTWLFRMESGIVLIVLGLMGNIIAYTIFRASQHKEFLHQLALVFNLCGQLMVAWGVYEAFDSFQTGFFLILFIYQLLLVVVLPDFLSRFLSTWFSMLALFLGLSKMGIFDVSPVLVSLLFVVVWMNDHKWLKRKSIWEPIGYGLALALLQFNTQVLLGQGFRWWLSMQEPSWFDHYSAWFNQIVVVGIFIGILASIVKQYGIKLQSKMGALIIAGEVLLIVMSYYVFGVSSALFLLLVGFIKQRRLLVALGIVSLIGFLSWYYYNLDLTLLTKSIILMNFGICFFVGFYFLNILDGGKKISFHHLKEKYRMTKTKWVAAGTICLILLLVNHNIYKKEQVLKNGQLVLLELAPVDPRSLMQGDYMSLRFAIERHMLDDEQSSYPSNGRGHFVVNMDENNVGTFSHFYLDNDLNKDQVKMQYNMRYGRIYLATHDFFFQEGTASEYEKARYGEFRVAENGELLLNNLRGESFDILGFNRPSN